MGKKAKTPAENSRPEPRAPGRPFQPGQSGNPGGRPAGLAAFRALLVDRKLDVAAADALELALKDADMRVAMDAVKHVHSYLFGKPMQAVEVSGPEGGPVESRSEVTSGVPDIAQLAAVARLLGVTGALPLEVPASEAPSTSDAEEDEILDARADGAPAGIPPP